jgi:TolB-like protein/DNA-binding winged helix-turn-helix (wHTH) protein/Tfp pilus assembly protein PilF
MPSTPARPKLFQLDLCAYRLLRNGSPIRLERQCMELLTLLVERKGELVTRDEIASRLWGDGVFVDVDRGANRLIRKLRLALGDDSQQPRFIETVIGKGYRFIGPVDVIAKQGEADRQGNATACSDLPTTWAPPIGVASRSRVAPADRVRAPIGISSSRLRLAVAFTITIAAMAVFATRFTRHGFQSFRSIAVLPLENLSGDPAQEYFADGMTDELITKLAQISSLHVVSRTTVMHYRGSKKPLPEIARELGVDVIVEGSVVRSGATARVTAQLIQASDDRHLWANEYTRGMGDVVTIQNDVALAIAEEIKAKLTPGEQAKLRQSPQVTPAAFEHYLKGRYFAYRLTPVDLAQGVLEFKEAVQLDPHYARAWASLADSYCWQASLGGLPPGQVLPLARDAAQHALAEDGTLAAPHKVLGWVAHRLDLGRGAEWEFQLAIQFDPNDAVTHGWYAIYLSHLGQTDKAVAEAHRAEELDPESAHISAMVEAVLLHVHRLEEAEAQIRRTDQLHPGYPWSRWHSVDLLEQRQNYQAAIDAALNAGLAHLPSSEVERWRAAVRNAGAPGYWQELARVLVLTGNAPEPDRVLLAIAAVERRDYNGALDLLQHVCRSSPDQLHTNLRVIPQFELLREDSRFRSLERCAGLP